MQQSRLLPVATLLATVSACGGARPAPDVPTSLSAADAAPAAPAPPDAAPTPPDAPAPTAFAVPAPTANVARLSAGKRPSELRYDLSPAVQIVDQTLDATVDVTAHARTDTQVVPTQQLGLTVELAPEGSGSSGAVLSLRLDRTMATDAAMSAELEDLVGTRLEHPIDDRGRAYDATIEVRAPDATAAATVAGLIRGRGAPILLPVEPIGIGGRWRVVTRDAVNGISAEITTTYTLVKRTDNVLTITGTIRSTSPHQPLAGTPGGEVLSMTGTGTLAATVRLDRAAPEIETKERYDAAMSVNGQTMRVVSAIATRQTTRDR